MHELGITRNLVAICTEHAHGAPVKRVTLVVGKLSAIMPESIRFCFDICAKGTLLENALLEIIEPPGLGRCRICEAEVPLSALGGRCACGSSDLQVVSGEELKIREMEVA
ncbi:MAG: hydrogenase maturation nickel metallochaperone HypA/HybF [Panacagrimonas sp.]